jgi:glycyl-tRNA synthetase beta chain
VKSERRDFLVEIGTEELPPRALPTLQKAFVASIGAGLAKAGLEHGTIAGFATPRRLAVRVKRLAARQPEQHLKRRGPPLSAAFDAAGSPTRAALAFAESCGTNVAALQRLDEGRGEFLFFVGSKAGASTVDLLPALVQSALDELPIPRRMHWASGDALFVRPVHWVVMLFGTDVVPATLLDTPAGRFTRGHRFHAPKPLKVSSPGSYEKGLRERGHVLADFDARRERIRAEVAAVAASLNGRALITEPLLDEVTALTEWPVAIAGCFAERFLELPREVLISTLETHQRCFPIEDAQGGLMPSFVTVSNIESRDPAKVREGNERVVRPRLADAAFFWAQDRKQPLAARAAALDTVTFQAKLGSVGDKVRRRHRGGDRRGARRGRARRGAVQVRPAVRHGGRVPGAAGHHGRLLRARRR